MILVAMGANLPSRYGLPEATLEAAKAEMERRGLDIISSSKTWLSPPMPVSDQPWYRNAVIAVQTPLDAKELMALLQSIEHDFGRIRIKGERNEARLLDLDILAYNEDRYDEEGLQIPHPRLHERSFVLYPLQEIAPDWTHPTLKRSVSEMIAGLPPDQDIHPLEDIVA